MSFFRKLFGTSKDANKPDSVTSKPSFPKPSISPSDPVIVLGMDFIDACRAAKLGDWKSKSKLSEIPLWSDIKSRDDNFRATFAYSAVCQYISSAYTRHRDKIPYKAKDIENRIPRFLMRKALPFSDQQMAEMLASCHKRQYLEYDNPIKSVLTAAEIKYGNAMPPGAVQKQLHRLIKKAHSEYGSTRESRDVKARAEALLQIGVISDHPQGPWTDLFLDQVPEGDADWNDLLGHALQNKGSSPSQKWLKTAKENLEKVGRDKFSDIFEQWARATKPAPTAPDAHTDLARGLVWMSALLTSDDIALALGELGQNCLTKVPDFGPRNQALGTACTISLMKMESPAAISELIRLRDKSKYTTTKAAIEKKLAKIADKQNVSVSQLEASSLPDFGFDPTGAYQQNFGEFRADIKLSGSKAKLTWYAADGAVRKTIPKTVRENFKSDVSAIKKKTKDMETVLKGQLTALEQSWLNDLSWPVSDWQALYLQHPLRANLTRQLIWIAKTADKQIAFLPVGGTYVGVDGKAIKLPKSSDISLWHPAMDDVKNVLAWRALIVEQTITQPIKQAHREVYILTDAERQTEIYSNRFAAHIIRQHQFNALCRARHWRYTLMGPWDSYNTPTKQIRAHNLFAEYHVDPAVEDAADYGMYSYLATDQVRFFDQEGQQLLLKDVPPLVLSEIMRDVDLFVGVASVANDPNWTDGGPAGRFGRYWTEHAFGNLGETAKMRKELLSGLIPKLAIADRLKILDKTLQVNGKRNTYEIHFGSGNIMIMPGKRYLCIVPGRKASQDKIYLPFEGDTVLSIILSKAFLLVNDDQIKDKTILSQL